MPSVTALEMAKRKDRMRGLVLGMAVGDALGLPFEGISPARIGRLIDPGTLGHRFLPGRGMISDDTEHLCLTSQALLDTGGDPDAFTRSLARRLRWWLAGLPAGIGFGTLRALIRLWIGFGPERSGVFTAGNGPAMRSPVIGAVFGLEPDRSAALVRASTAITHTDPKAEQGALVVAKSAWEALELPAAPPPLVASKRRDPLPSDGGRSGADPTGSDPILVLEKVAGQAHDPELVSLLSGAGAHLKTGSSVTECARDLGISGTGSGGVSGYMYHTVPVVVYAWLRHLGDFEATVESVIRAGGDTDTGGAIAGALAGATVGESGIPLRWIDGLLEWPRSVAWMRRLADRLTDLSAGMDSGPLPLFWPGVIPRNALFAAAVLGHGFRRLLPPY